MPAQIRIYVKYDSLEFRIFMFDPASPTMTRPGRSSLVPSMAAPSSRWTWGRSLGFRSAAGSDRLDQTPIHPHERTRDIGRRRARQEGHHGGELLGLAVASQRDGGPGLGGDRGHVDALPLGVGGVDLVDPLGVDAAGHYAVDGDAVGGDLVRQALRPAD